MDLGRRLNGLSDAGGSGLKVDDASVFCFSGVLVCFLTWAALDDGFGDPEALDCH